MRTKCNRCTRPATSANIQYHDKEWLCTYHSNKITIEGRRERKYGSRTITK